MEYQARYEEWLSKLEENDPLMAQLKAIENDEKEKEERFYQDLSFGTAGLRGKVGAGTNRMNFLTVGKQARVLLIILSQRDKRRWMQVLSLLTIQGIFRGSFLSWLPAFLLLTELRFILSQAIVLHRNWHI